MNGCGGLGWWDLEVDVALSPGFDEGGEAGKHVCGSADFVDGHPVDFSDFGGIGHRHSGWIEVRKPPGEARVPWRDAGPTKPHGLDVDREFFLHLADNRFTFCFATLDSAAGQTQLAGSRDCEGSSDDEQPIAAQNNGDDGSLAKHGGLGGR